MTHKLDSTQTAIVTHDVHWILVSQQEQDIIAYMRRHRPCDGWAHDRYWIPVSRQEPRYGTKCFVIDKEQGIIGHVRRYRPGDGWTHWHPMFTFAKDEK